MGPRGGGKGYVEGGGYKETGGLRREGAKYSRGGGGNVEDAFKSELRGRGGGECSR